MPSSDTSGHSVAIVNAHEEGANASSFAINSELRVDDRNTGTTQYGDSGRHESGGVQPHDSSDVRCTYFAFAAVGQ